MPGASVEGTELSWLWPCASVSVCAPCVLPVPSVSLCVWLGMSSCFPCWFNCTPVTHNHNYHLYLILAHPRVAIIFHLLQSLNKLPLTFIATFIAISSKPLQPHHTTCLSRACSLFILPRHNLLSPSALPRHTMPRHATHASKCSPFLCSIAFLTSIGAIK